MVDFNEPTPTYSAKRVYATINDFEDFCDVKDTFLNDTSMSLADKEFKTETYSTVVNYSKNGEVGVTVKITADTQDAYANTLSDINISDIAVDALGTGATSAEDREKRNWKMTFKGETTDGDSFTLLIDESYALLSGYHLPATLTTVETWADTVPILSVALNE